MDVEQVQAGAFCWTPTPAIIAPLEYTMLLRDYEAMGGHVEAVKPFTSVRGAVFRQKKLRIKKRNLSAPPPLTGGGWGVGELPNSVRTGFTNPKPYKISETD